MATFRSAPLLFLSLTLLLDGCSSGKASPPAPAPPEVSVITAAAETVSLSPASGSRTLDGYVNAQIRPQVSGYLAARNYQRGRARAQGRGAVRDRPAAVRGRAGAGARRSCAEAQAQLGKTERDSSATGRWPRSARLRRASSTTTSRPTSRRRPPCSRRRPPSRPRSSISASRRSRRSSTASRRSRPRRSAISSARRRC